MAQFFTWTTQEGTPITVSGRTLTPQAQALHLNWPGGGYVWNRPTGIAVEQNGQTEHHTIPDPTRFAVLALWMATGLAGMIAILVSVRR